MRVESVTYAAIAGLVCLGVFGCREPRRANSEQTVAPDASMAAPDDAPEPAPEAEIVVSPGCPREPPTVGTPCVPSIYACTYGSDPIPYKRRRFYCSNNTWIDDFVPPEIISAKSCPKTLSAANGTKCGEPGRYCAYGDRFCVCTSPQCDGDCKTQVWFCPDPNKDDPRCPVLFPSSEEPCSVEGLRCTYYFCGAGVGAVCESGSWRQAAPICVG